MALRQPLRVAVDHDRRGVVGEVVLPDRPPDVGHPVAEPPVGREVGLAARKARPARNGPILRVVDREGRHAVRRVGAGRVHEHPVPGLGVRDQDLFCSGEDVDLAGGVVPREVDQRARAHPERDAAPVVGPRVGGEDAVLDCAAAVELHQVERRRLARRERREVPVGRRQAQVDEVPPVGSDVDRHVVAAGHVGRELPLGRAVEAPRPDAPVAPAERFPGDEAVTEGGHRLVVRCPALGTVLVDRRREVSERSGARAAGPAARDVEQGQREPTDLAPHLETRTSGLNTRPSLMDGAFTEGSRRPAAGPHAGKETIKISAARVPVFRQIDARPAVS